ncbi:MAG: hypothetical protein H6742_20425 [Alphaproteobacteria bacterium]|nr:hypothetical protein [Alphaproteobacteria bacterium]
MSSFRAALLLLPLLACDDPSGGDEAVVQWEPVDGGFDVLGDLMDGAVAGEAGAVPTSVAITCDGDHYQFDVTIDGDAQAAVVLGLELSDATRVLTDAALEPDGSGAWSLFLEDWYVGWSCGEDPLLVGVVALDAAGVPSPVRWASSWDAAGAWIQETAASTDQDPRAYTLTAAEGVDGAALYLLDPWQARVAGPLDMADDGDGAWQIELGSDALGDVGDRPLWAGARVVVDEETADVAGF